MIIDWGLSYRELTKQTGLSYDQLKRIYNKQQKEWENYVDYTKEIKNVLKEFENSGLGIRDKLNFVLSLVSE